MEKREKRENISKKREIGWRKMEKDKEGNREKNSENISKKGRKKRGDMWKKGGRGKT